MGAGDVFNAGVVTAHLRGGDVVHGMMLGTVAASVYVSRRTSRFPTFDEISPLVGTIAVRSVGSRTGVIDPERRAR